MFTSCSDCFLHLKEEQKPVVSKKICILFLYWFMNNQSITLYSVPDKTAQPAAQKSACEGFSFKPCLTKEYANPPPNPETKLQSCQTPNQKQKFCNKIYNQKHKTGFHQINIKQHEDSQLRKVHKQDG